MSFVMKRPPASTRLAIRRLERDFPTNPKAIDDFFAANTFPVVEGATVTFVYRGEADEVNLRHWIFGLPSSQPLTRIAGSDVWYFILELPEKSRVEYKFEVVRAGMRRWIEDPLNPHRARDPFGANSVCQAAGYVEPEWALHDPEAREGRIEELVMRSRVLGGRRQVSIYLPARYRPSRRYPLLLVHDGGDYVDYAGFKTVLDNLIHRLEIPGVVAALLHPKDRLTEYAANPEHDRFLTEELVPILEREYSLVGEPEGRCLMGASFGAVACLSAAWHAPGFYGRLLLQSGSFAFTDIGANERGPAFDPVVDLVNEVRDEPKAFSERVFVSCGIYESLIYENRSLVPLLQSTGMEVRYVEARDGHNWENWRDRLREGLSWLFPGPLWMVYD
jgi:enterochelin esterase family protein